ncbi:ubiquinol-cytochrome-c reductase complex subunit 6 [Mucidula mucida]|nr:ubiquinol-cytochrome-c reductase complex subunit 6 [Mucidula mucida]
MFGPLSVSLAPLVNSSKTLSKWVVPIAKWYTEAQGYRKYGFKYDDLLIEEREDVQRAIKRLTPAEQYDRAYRLKRACQASVLHKPLPKEQWTKPEEDIRYLAPHVENVAAEDQEKVYWDNLTVKRK